MEEQNQGQGSLPKSYRQQISYMSKSHTIFNPPKTFVVVQDKRLSLTALHTLLTSQRMNSDSPASRNSTQSAFLGSSARQV